MEQVQISALAEMLQARRQLIVSSMPHLCSREETGLKVDDLGTAVNTDAVQVQRAQIAAGLLRQIEKALNRIKDGTYGTCVNPLCEAQIEEKRLKASPWALLCIKCAEEVEAASSGRRMKSGGRFPPALNRRG